MGFAHECVSMLYNPVSECSSSSLLTVAHWNKRAEQTDWPTLCVCSDCMSAHERVLQVTVCVCTVCVQSVSLCM